MDAEFWHNRWQEGRVGFHQSDVNASLKRWWPQLELPDQATVFVPLCGKSLDMLWLAAQGYQVLGVELSAIAVQSFFAEQNVQPEVEQRDNFVSYSANNVTILCGDFFDLKTADLKDVAAVFDRAALIALPKQLRQAYANHLREILPAGSQMLLIAVEYDETAMTGPPFSVPWTEIAALFDQYGELKMFSEQSSQARGTPCLERYYHFIYA